MGYIGSRFFSGTSDMAAHNKYKVKPGGVFERIRLIQHVPSNRDEALGK
jgi:hypothetical protein